MHRSAHRRRTVVDDHVTVGRLKVNNTTSMSTITCQVCQHSHFACTVKFLVEVQVMLLESRDSLY